MQAIPIHNLRRRREAVGFLEAKVKIPPTRLLAANFREITAECIGEASAQIR